MSVAADFMAAAPRLAQAGNTPWADRYANELRRVIHEHAARAPRSNQAHLGPSELGVPCDRQVAGKLAGLPYTNHVADPWPSIVGTAVHAWLADAFMADNARHNLRRWVAEQRVVPHPDHPGTADLYDAQERAVVDHKALGETSMAKVRRPEGPPIAYQVQLILYGAGYRNLGLPVERVVLAAYPRTAASLQGMYVWERATGAQDDAIVEEVIKLTAARRAWAERINSGEVGLNDVPASPDDDTCYFCPFYRPQSARDGGPGCPGNRTGH